MKSQSISYESYYRQCIDAVQKYFPHIPRVHAVLMIDEAEEVHGQSYIIGMAGFLAYARENKRDVEERSIRSTLAHDLNCRKDQFMLPRTAEYAEFAKSELILN